MYVHININNFVKIKLTLDGLEHLQQYYRNLGLFGAASLSELEWYGQLWEVMAIFGDQMYMGNTKIMFENNQIQIDMGAD